MVFIGAKRIPTVTAAQMREVDRLAIEEFGLPLLSLMENAGRALASLAVRRFTVSRGKRILCLAGEGGNGGGGLAAGRHLANWGLEVEAVILKSAPGSASEVQANILRRSEIQVHPAEELSRLDVRDFDLVIDAILGYSVRGNPSGPAKAMVETTNRAPRVLALDLPSGLNPDDGVPGTPCVRATATLTLALPKPGLLRPEAAPYVGELWLADLGIPMGVYARLGLAVPPLFRAGQILRRLSGPARGLRAAPR